MQQYLVEGGEKKKKTQKIENPEYRKIFIFSLKETESLGVGDGDYDLDCDLGHVLCALSACSTPGLFPHSAEQGASFMHPLSKHLQRLCCVLGLVAGSVFGEMTKT